jgi:splicing factor 3A subunit 1
VRRKKAATGYDGGPLEKGDRARLEMMQSVNVEEQIRAIHEKFGEKK